MHEGIGNPGILAEPTPGNVMTAEREPRRAVIYARVSQDPRQQLRSVSQQISESEAECERRGWTVVRVFKDNDRSASRYATKVRPEYAKLIECLRGGGADVLVTWESSRAQRDLEAYVKLRDLAEKNGVRWSYKGRLYDLSRTDDRFTTGLDALLDERESSVTRDRILRDVRNNAAKGRPHGRLLYGYQRHYDPRTGDLLGQTVHEAHGEIVREAVRRVAAGDSARAVAADFNRRGIPTSQGKKWNERGIRLMITNPGYVGKRVHQGKVVGDANWPALLKGDDRDAFYTCVQRYGDPSRKGGRESRVLHLLSGLIKCGRCGGKVYFLRGAVKRKGVRRIKGENNYVCKGAHTGAPRGCVGVQEAKLDQHIIGLVLDRLSRPDAVDLLANGERAQDAQNALAEAAEKRARVDEAADLFARGEMSATMATRIETQLMPEIQAAENRAREVGITAVLRDVIRPDIADVWPGLPMTQRREVIRALMEITLLPASKSGGAARALEVRRVRIDWKHDL